MRAPGRPIMWALFVLAPLCAAFPRAPRGFARPLARGNARGGSLETPVAAVSPEVGALAAESEVDVRTPVTLLSGFLGAGKTTLLKHILENKEGLRIALIVNDVAEVNIDSKLVRDMPTSPERNDETTMLDLIELQNGCACCSLTDELFGSLSQLQQMARVRGFEYDHFVIEASGIAEPIKIRDQFQEAEDLQFAVMQEIRLDTLITVVDASSFMDYYTSKDRVGDRDDMDLPKEDVAGDLVDVPYQRAVVDLLVEQTETADVIVLSKSDIAGPRAVDLTRAVLKNLNPGAKIVEAVYGKVPLAEVLAVAAGASVAVRGAIDDHKFAVKQAGGCSDSTHDHSHASSDHATAESSCADATCTKTNHDDCASSASAPVADTTCTKPACSDTSHSHSHDHAVAESSCDEPACADTACNDPTHDHSHSGNQGQETTASERFDIRSVVYRARRPFHPERLLQVFQCLQGGGAVLRALEEGSEPQPIDTSAGADAEKVNILGGVMRSKGFLWLASTDQVAYYWSHAGAHADVQVMGKWWAAVSEDQWPEGFSEAIKQDYDEATGRGDRRQELVVIGTGLGGDSAVNKILDEALLTDEELQEYDALRSEEDLQKSEERLRELFPNPFAG